MLSALNDAIPDEILSEWETGASSNTNGGGLSNGSVDNSGPTTSGASSGPGGMANGPQQPPPPQQPQMGGGMGMPGGMRPQMSNPNMNLVMNKNKVVGGPGGPPPPASSDNLTSINSSMHSSAQVGRLVGLGAD